jgi:hypothetical protein
MCMTTKERVNERVTWPLKLVAHIQTSLRCLRAKTYVCSIIYVHFMSADATRLADAITKIKNIRYLSVEMIAARSCHRHGIMVCYSCRRRFHKVRDFDWRSGKSKRVLRSHDFISF